MISSRADSDADRVLAGDLRVIARMVGESMSAAATIRIAAGERVIAAASFGRPECPRTGLECPTASVSVPLPVDEHRSGVLCLHHDRPFRQSAPVAELLPRVGAQIGRLVRLGEPADEPFYETMAALSRTIRRRDLTILGRPA